MTERPPTVADQGQPTVEEKLATMEREGTLVRTTIRNWPRKVGKPIPGALDRFLADRDDEDR